MLILKPNFAKRGGLITVVVQDNVSKEVLMVAFSDKAGWIKTMETGLVSLYSTSREKSWVKGEESGNFMKLITALIDCDGDTVIYMVEPQGNKRACHTDARSCFFRDIIDGHFLATPKLSDKEMLEQVEVNLHPDLMP